MLCVAQGLEEDTIQDQVYQLLSIKIINKEKESATTQFWSITLGWNNKQEQIFHALVVSEKGSFLQTYCWNGKTATMNGNFVNNCGNLCKNG